MYSRHESAILARRKKRDNCNALQIKVSNIHHEICLLEKDTKDGTSCKSSHEEYTKKHIMNPEDLLTSLIFRFLDFKDILQLKSVCKLWSELTDSNLLWKPLYEHHFGSKYTHWLSMESSVAHDWKLLFCSTFSAQHTTVGKKNEFGWQIRICPTVGCNKELQNKLEYDLHVLKHEQSYCLNRVKYLKKLKREQNRQERRKS